MKPFSIILTLTLLFIVSCSGGALRQAEIDQWLKTVSGNAPPAMNLHGKWQDAKGKHLFGWGEGYLRQKQNRIRGTIGNYNVEGVVSGDRAYLVFLYGGTVYYTARLEMFKEGLLTGNYFEADDLDQVNGYPTSLEKTGDLE